MKAQIQFLFVCLALVFGGVASAQDKGDQKAVEPIADNAAAANPGSPSCPQGVGTASCGIGPVQANCVDTRSGYPSPLNRIRFAVRDRISPRPFYSYSKHGIEAQLTHQWNQQQMNNYAWHCNNSYWQYGRPTALVVPPNAGFQTVYSWGVGNTRSVPIYHQFGRAYPGHGTAPKAGEFPATPYWPYNTQQFGIYPVRAPF